MSWFEYAACSGADPELFFPDKKDSSAGALRVCRWCSVREECLDWALDRRERWGVWGGMTEEHRAIITRITRKEAS